MATTKIRFKGVMRWILALAFLMQLGMPSFAQQSDQGFVTKAPRAIVVDTATGGVLFQQRADDLAAPASMSKLMTLAVLFKAIKDGKISTSDSITMSTNAWRTGGAPSGNAAMMVPVKSSVTIGELIQGIAVQSGNDASIAVAETMAGNEAAFAKLMTQEARRIGLTKSTFGNATGLTDDNNLMTVRELAMLAGFLIKEYPEQYSVFGQKEFPYRKHKFYNRNPLLFLDVGADGLMTGNSKEAGYGLVASAVRDGRRLIVAVGGLPTADARKTEAAKMLEWGFGSFSKVRLFDEGEAVGRARVWGGTKMYVSLVSNGPVTIDLPKYPANQRLTAEIVYRAPLKPPVRKGEQVATLKVMSTSSAQAEIPLYASEDVGVAGMAWRGMDTLLIMALRRLTL